MGTHAIQCGAMARKVLWTAMAVTVVSAMAQTPAYRAPQVAGHPDLNGIWQALNEANYDIEGHTARAALALQPGPYGPVPAAPVLAMGAVGAVPPGLGVVEAGDLPYRAEALATKKKNQENWLTSDPEIKCYLPGVPRATYLPYPFQIIESATQMVFVYEYAGAVRNIFLNDQTWFDRAGNFHSDALHVVERYRRTSPDVISYEATIEDPKVFTRPWKMSMALYRRQEKNAQLLDFKCVEFVEELLYGQWRKKPLGR